MSTAVAESPERGRCAVIAVRAVTVQLRGPWRPGAWQVPLPITAVEREVDAPVGVTPIRGAVDRLAVREL